MSRLEELLDLDVLRHYDRLALHVRRGMGDRPGDRRFPGRPQASGTEVESYASYTPGDDVRHLDWNALGRLDTLLVRRFTAEREVPIHLLIDCSASMSLPAPDRKHELAVELAMAIGYLGLSSNDAVQVVLLTTRGAHASPVFRQRPGAVELARFLAEATAEGALDLGSVLVDYAGGRSAPGVVVVLSDFMTEVAALAPGVTALRSVKHEVHLVQIVGPGELDPTRDFASGVLRDVESGATHAVQLTAATVAQYETQLAEHFAAVSDLATSAGAGYVRATSDVAVADIVTGDLARLGMVRRR